MIDKAAWALGLGLLVVLAGCDSSSSGNGGNDPDGAGVLLDAVVEGVDFSAEDGDGNTVTGTTGVDGLFDYFTGQDVTFSIGDILLGTLTGQEVVTPVDLVEGAENPIVEEVLNLLRFLQSVDEDQDLSNGISVSDEVREAAVGASIDFSVESDLTDFLDPLSITLIAGATALTNFLDEIGAYFEYPFDPQSGLEPAQGVSWDSGFVCGSSASVTFNLDMDAETFTSETVRVYNVSDDPTIPLEFEALDYDGPSGMLEIEAIAGVNDTVMVVLGTGIQQADGTPLPAPFYWFWIEDPICG